MSMNPTGNETLATPFERALVANANYFAVAPVTGWAFDDETEEPPSQPEFYRVGDNWVYGVERRCHFNHDEDCGV